MSPGTIPFTVSRETESVPRGYTTHVGLRVSISSTAVNPNDGAVFYFQLPSGFLKPVEDRFSLSPVRKTQAGGRSSASRLALFSGIR
jgi:hypothetical protein